MKNLISRTLKAIVATAVLLSGAVSCEDTHRGGSGSGSASIIGLWASVDFYEGTDPDDAVWQDSYDYVDTFLEVTDNGVIYIYRTDAEAGISNGIVSGVTRSDLNIEQSTYYDSIENGQIISGNETLGFYMPTRDRLMVASSSVGYGMYVRCKSFGNEEENPGGDPQTSGCDPYEHFDRLVKTLDIIYEEDGDDRIQSYYDGADRLTKAVANSTDGVYSSTTEMTLTYEDGGFTMETVYQSGTSINTEIYEFTVNSDGYITGYDTYYNGSPSESYLFTYSDGNAVSMTSTPAYGEPQYTSNSWINGNLMSGQTACMPQGEYTYLNRQNNLNINILMQIPSFKGMTSDRLFSSFNAYGDEYTFEYTFDSKGYPVKVVQEYVSAEGPETTVYEITYY